MVSLQLALITLVSSSGPHIADLLSLSWNFAHCRNLAARLTPTVHTRDLKPIELAALTLCSMYLCQLSWALLTVIIAASVCRICSLSDSQQNGSLCKQ